jgi:hypothetical protein
MDELKEIKLEIEKLVRYKQNLEKNFERKEKLNLIDDQFKRTHLIEVNDLNDKLSRLKRKYRMIESQEIRKKNIY